MTADTKSRVRLSYFFPHTPFVIGESYLFKVNKQSNNRHINNMRNMQPLDNP